MGKIMRQNVHILLKSQLDIAKLSKNHMTKRPHFAEQPAGYLKWVQKSCDKPSKFRFRKGGHDVSEHFEEGERHVTCDKPSTSKPGWTKNTWTDHTGVRMSQGQVVTADGLLGGRIVWFELSRGWFVGGWIIKASI
jgi:hypothetical protein